MPPIMPARNMMCMHTYHREQTYQVQDTPMSDTKELCGFDKTLPHALMRHGHFIRNAQLQGTPEGPRSRWDTGPAT